MADKKPEKVEALEYEPQDDEAREEMLKRTPSGSQTATGQARIEHFGEREEPEHRGSPLEIAGGEPEPTLSTKKSANKPRGLQKEEAQYVPNGTMPYGMVASPSGPVPVSAVSGRADAAARKLAQEEARVSQEKEGREGSLTKLSDEQISTLSPAQLRAIGADRGYNLPAGGARVIRRKFAEAQANDPQFNEAEEPQTTEEELEKAKGTGTPTSGGDQSTGSTGGSE